MDSENTTVPSEPIYPRILPITMSRPSQAIFRNLRSITALNRRFLRQFVSAVAVADGLGPWNQGTAAYVAWLLGPEMRVGLDDHLMEVVCRSIRKDQRFYMLRVPYLTHLKPESFGRIMDLVQDAMVHHPSKVSYGELARWARVMLLFAQQNPQSLRAYDRAMIRKIGRIRRNWKQKDRLYLVCLQVVVGVDVEANVRRMLSSRRDTDTIGVIADAMNIPFLHRDQVLKAITAAKDGRAILSRMKSVQMRWKGFSGASS